MQREKHTVFGKKVNKKGLPVHVYHWTHSRCQQLVKVCTVRKLKYGMRTDKAHGVTM